MIYYLLLGFIIQFTTSLDDTITRVPVLASVTRTRKGRIIFSLGNLLAVTVAVIIAIVFSRIIDSLPGAQYIAAVLIALLALTVYFDIFVTKPKITLAQRLKKVHSISPKRFFKLLGIGFTVSFVTVLDDIVALAPLFLEEFYTSVAAVVGIFAATILQIILVIYFAEKINRFKYKKELATGSLLLLALLILVGII